MYIYIDNTFVGRYNYNYIGSGDNDNKRTSIRIHDGEELLCFDNVRAYTAVLFIVPPRFAESAVARGDGGGDGDEDP